MTSCLLDRPVTAFRHELKYPISAGEDLMLALRLRKLFPHDTHAGPSGTYRVSSLYFDTPNDQALREKVDGVDRREKFRLRYYGEQPTFLRLEKKLKQNGLCAKRTARLTREQAEALLGGEDRFLLESGDPLLAEFYSKRCARLLRPRTVVCYDREAFVYPPGNVRITLDRALRTDLSPEGFLDPARGKAPTGEGMTVLEIKYDAFLPDLVRMAVALPDRRASAYSKYAVCRRYD